MANSKIIVRQAVLVAEDSRQIWPASARGKWSGAVSKAQQSGQ